MLVNIIHPFTRTIFSHYFDFFEQYEGFVVKENSSDDECWDLVIVFENVATLTHLKCKSGGLVFISGEPEEGVSYTRDFINQFDIVYSTHSVAKYAKHQVQKQFFNDWHFGLNYDDYSFSYTFNELSKLRPPNKTRNISIVCSSLEQLPRHVQRVKFIKAIKDHFGNKIDFFGRGFNFIPDKADALLDYKFHICIENSESKDLWTEKLADPYLAYTLPIYSGCSNINEYFPESSYLKLNIDDIHGSINILDNLLNNIDSEYQKGFFSLTIARHKILNEYNIFSEIVKLAEQSDSLNQTFISCRIYPNELTRNYKVSNFFLRLSRLIRRIPLKLL